MRELATAEVLPVPVLVNGRTYFWTAPAGLDPAVVRDVEAWIRRRANGFASAARMRGLDLDDLLQEGRAGVLRAAQSFNPGAGTTFLHYADYWIRQAMFAALDRCHAVYLPNRHRQQALKDGTLPGVLCLDAPIPDHEGCLLDLQPSEQPTPLETAQQAEIRLKLWAALGQLTPIQRTILIFRYGLDGPEESLETVARRLGCGRERVRRIQLYAEAQLRTHLRETPMEPTKPKPRPTSTLQHIQHRQVTVQDVIRDRQREERSAAQTAKTRRKAAKDATKGAALFDDGEV